MKAEKKAVFTILHSNSPVVLIDLKSQSGLSNKKWGKAIKGLIRKDLAKVEKIEEELMVRIL